MENKDSYSVIEKKLQLAEMTIELGRVTCQKWANHELHAKIMAQEENLLKQIAELTKTLDEG